MPWGRVGCAIFVEEMERSVPGPKPPEIVVSAAERAALRRSSGVRDIGGCW